MAEAEVMPDFIPDNQVMASMPDFIPDEQVALPGYKFGDFFTANPIGRAIKAIGPTVTGPGTIVGDLPNLVTEQGLKRDQFMSTPIVQPANLIPEDHPILKGAAEAIGGFTSPTGALLLGTTAGLSAASPIIQRMISAGFSADMIHDLYQNYGQFKQAIDQGDEQTAKRILGQALVTGPLAGLTAFHALKPGVAPIGEPKPVEETALPSISKPADVVNFPVKEALRPDFIPDSEVSFDPYKPLAETPGPLPEFIPDAEVASEPGPGSGSERAGAPVDQGTPQAEPITEERQQALDWANHLADQYGEAGLPTKEKVIIRPLDENDQPYGQGLRYHEGVNIDDIPLLQDIQQFSADRIQTALRNRKGKVWDAIVDEAHKQILESNAAPPEEDTSFDFQLPEPTADFIPDSQVAEPPAVSTMADLSRAMAEASQKNMGQAANELVGQMGDKILGGLKKAGDLEGSPLFPKEEEPSLFTEKPAISRAEALRKLVAIRESKPHSEAKRFGTNGPTPEQKTAYDAEVKSWNKEFRAADKAFKLADAEEKQQLFGPGARSVKEPTPANIAQLTEAVRGATTEGASITDRMKIGREIATQVESAKDSASQAFASLKGNAAALWDAYQRPQKWTEFKDMLGKYLGSRQRSGLDTHRFVKEIVSRIPAEKQVAMVNWLEAAGDEKILGSRATLAPALFKKGYEDALKLSPNEKILAQNFRNYFDSQLEEARKAGVLEQGVEDYVNHIWKKDNPATLKIKSEINAGLLQVNPALAKKRVWSTYFEGEMQGAIPKNKSIGYLAAAYDQSLNEAIAARGFIRSLLDGKASDGRELAAVSGSGKTLGDLPDQPDGYIIKPKTKPENTEDYRPIDHPALRRWKWVAKDAEGKPILVQGDILIHPEAYSHLKNVLGKSAIRENPIGRGLLATTQTLKSTLLSLSGFHQTQEGLHAIFHKVNPTTAPEIDLTSKPQMDLVEHGLMIYNHNALADFAEGVHSGGLLNRVPGLGGILQKYGTYLFQDYIPRLKMKMATEALERNTERYGRKLDRNQILETTANQANAAFGELNYKYMGRNPTLQDAMRLITLAPDFLEARSRFVGQALKPYGREQASALLRGALGMYVVARVANELLDKDAHWDRPFSLVLGGREFTLRSVPGDIYHLFSDPQSFVYHRLNPTIAKPIIEGLVTGRDQYGNQRSFTEQVKDWFTGHVPIPLQGLTGKDRTLLDSALTSLGVSAYPYRSSAEKTAIKYIQENTPKGEKTPLQKEQSMRHWKILEDLRAGHRESLDKAKAEGDLAPRQAIDLLRKSKSTRLQVDVKGLPLSVALDVWDKANDEERKQIRREINVKMVNFLAGKSKEEKAQLMPRIERFKEEQRANQ